MADATATAPNHTISTNSWLKVQHLPTFGGSAGLHIPVYEWSALEFVLRLPAVLMYAVGKGQYVLRQWGLDPETTEKVKKHWRQLGVKTMVVIPGTTVRERQAFWNQR